MSPRTTPPKRKRDAGDSAEQPRSSNGNSPPTKKTKASPATTSPDPKAATIGNEHAAGDSTPSASDAASTKQGKPSSAPALSSDATLGAKRITGAGLSSLKKAKKDPSQRTKPVSRRQERTPPRAREREPSPRKPSRSPSRSPPRQRKRPGVSGRVSRDTLETVRRRQEERERAALGVASNDAVAQHYNAVPERGREWRQTGSRIKGLRSFNNWVKSALIQKFSPNENYTPGARQHGWQAEQDAGLRVLDIGCGKGGDLQKWQNAPQGVEVYVGLDPAAVSVEQAADRYRSMPRFAKYGDFRGRPLYHAEFTAKDCFGESLADVPIVQQIGIDFTRGPTARGGGFDVVSMMFCMHYAFENEARARGMLKNVAGALKKGGRFLGVIPNSDVLSAKVKALAGGGKATPAANGAASAREPSLGGSEEGEWDPEKPAEDPTAGLASGAGDDDDWDPEKPSEPAAVTGAGDDDDDDWDPEKPSEPAAAPTANGDGSGATPHKSATPKEPAMTEGPTEWGNSIHRVKFPEAVPKNGVFRPTFGWKYFFFLEEAVEEVPEFVVPWEAFRAMAMDYDLELAYRKPFHEVWAEEKGDGALGELSERMGVRDRRSGALLVSRDEMEASSLYHAFCFVKT